MYKKLKISSKRNKESNKFDRNTGLKREYVPEPEEQK